MYPFLRHPRLSGVIVEIRNMQSRLVRHRKLSNITCMIGKLCIKIKFRPTQRLLKHLIEVLDKQFISPHQFDQIRNIVLYIPAIDPGIVFTIILPCSLSARKHIIKRHDKISLVIFGMEKFGLFVEKISIIERLLHKEIIISLNTQFLSKLCQAP
ncbi:hypothetical protein D3C81_1187820 [compost metagenome]